MKYFFRAVFVFCCVFFGGCNSPKWSEPELISEKDGVKVYMVQKDWVGKVFFVVPDGAKELSPR